MAAVSVPFKLLLLFSSRRQLSPFPFDAVKQQLDLYCAARDVIWAQEEAKNNGAWTFVKPRFETTAGAASIVR